MTVGRVVLESDLEAAAEERRDAVESHARYLAERPARMEALAQRTVELLELLVKAGK